MFGNLGLPELIVLFVLIMLLFGARKLPEFGKGLGSGIRNFKSALRQSEEDDAPEVHSAEPVREVPERTGPTR